MLRNKQIHVFTFFLIFLLFLTGMILAQKSQAQGTIVVTSPAAGGVVLAEIDEFATNVMGDPWDMNEKSDLTNFRSESQMVNSTFANGMYSAQMTNGQGGERVTLLNAGAPNHTAMRIGKIGYTFPINANHYKYLTLRFFKGCTCSSGLTMWFETDAYTDAVKGVSNSYSLPAAAGWHTKVIDLSSIGIQSGAKGWEGTIRELIVKPFAGSGAANATFRLDWARLTAVNPQTARPFTVTWSGGSGNVDIYASLGNTTLDERDVLLAQNVNGSAGSATIQTGTLQAGEYFIGIDDGSSISWSSGPLILNSVPQTTITRPSMTSGEEYAETVLGNAWDMNHTNDLNDVLPIGWETCVSNPSFTNGIYHATLTGCSTDTTTTDARFILGHMDRPGSPDPTIDTSKYRYFSVRHWLEGEQNVAEGWVARFGWWQNGVSEIVMSRDIILYEDWNTYKVDLWAADVVDEAHPIQRSWQNSAPNRLRFDPAELFLAHLPADIQTDWIKLAAMDEANSGDLFPIEYDVNSDDAVDLTFYYDTDKNPGNGRTLIGSTSALANRINSSPPANEINSGSDTIYLPVIMNRALDCQGPGCFVWNTQGVPPGTYYVCVNTEDNFNSSYRCSEAPMNIR